jgi:ferrous iron transport protein B
MISGIAQRIANYPGVTVEKKTGRFKYQKQEIEVVDLPGTYSFSSYSLEERVSKDFIAGEDIDIIINVVDAANLKRNLYFTFQLLETGYPVIIVLNMSDVATRRGIKIDTQALSRILKTDVIEASAAKKRGKKEILDSLIQRSKELQNYKNFEINYEELEDYIQNISDKITLKSEIKLPKRWVAIKALEGDPQTLDWIKNPTQIEVLAQEYKENFKQKTNNEIDPFIASTRYQNAELVYHKCVDERQKIQKTLTDTVDKIILNRFFAYPILFLVLFGVYEIAIVYGYKITDYTWPYLASFKTLIEGYLPKGEFLDVPIVSSFIIWMINSVNALLNYVPVFFLLFAMIAILEGIGYMPRMAFILDRLFRKYGLHGQSTLPLVLGGAIVGGCAVPGVMATKGIADERARLATILTVPYMNCLAKVPFYTLLLGAFFASQMSIMMFYIATVTIFIALIVAKFMTMSILKNRETAPFVMELPPYHLPSFYGVIKQAFERVWIYIKKVATIVLAVAAALFVLLQYPGLSDERKSFYDAQLKSAIIVFDTNVAESSYYDFIDSKEEVGVLLNAYEQYRNDKMNLTSKEAAEALNIKLIEQLGKSAGFINPGGDRELRDINKALKDLSNKVKILASQIHKEKIENSLMGSFGKSLEPVTQFAGFDWKINVAFLSSFAARESAVATIGSIYEENKASNQRAEESIASSGGYTSLSAVAMIIFMILTPPCIATMIVVKYQSGSYKWMLFAIFFPFSLAILSAITIYQVGLRFDLNGFEAMSLFYISVVTIAFLIGLIPDQKTNFKGGFMR